MTPQELKNSILQLAIQGKLVEQRADEGTGAELLEKILAAKDAKKNLTRSRGARGGCNEGELFNLPKAAKSHPEKFSALSASPRDKIPDDEKPFDIPESWEWYRIGDLFNIVNGFTPLKSNLEFWSNGDIPWFTIEDVRRQGRFIYSTEKFITQKALAKNTERVVPPDTVLLCCTASVGEYAYAKIPLTTNQQFNAFVVKKDYQNYIYPLYVFEYVKTLKNNLIDRAGKTTFNFVSVGKLSKMLIPLPPLAEQKRIVAKIEELMPLVDRYEKAWSRLEDFNKRFPVDMQKSLLQMAIQGKLVEQSADEGTGAELLEKIFAAKDAKKNLTQSRGARGGCEAEVLNVANVQQLPISNTSFQLGNEERGMRKLGIGNNGNGNISTLATLKNLSALSASPRDKIPDDEKPFEIPESWEWVRLGEVANVQLGKMLDKGKNKGILYPYLANLSVRWRSFDLSTLRMMPFTEIESEKFALLSGDVLMCEGGVPGRCAVWRETNSSVKYQKAIHRIRSSILFSDFIQRYFETICNSTWFVGKFTGTTIKHLPREALRNTPIPLPPHAEQKRIVAKLEELLPLCERLK